MSDTSSDASKKALLDSFDDVVDTEIFESVEDMQAACVKNGWSISFRQLQSGNLTAATYARTCAGINILDQIVTRRIEVDAIAPSEYVTVLAPIGNGEFSLNGKTIDEHGLYLLGPGAELHSVNNGILRVMAMNIPNVLLQETSHSLSAFRKTNSEGSVVVRPGPLTVQRLRTLMHATIYQPNSHFDDTERAMALVCDMASIIDQCAVTRPLVRQDSLAESWRMICRAREYIEANLEGSIQIGDLCQYSASSLSKLERTFRKYLQMSPSQYVLARRLSAVNHSLSHSKSDNLRISDIAMNYGFNHLGRFSSAYHRQFGELPSHARRKGQCRDTSLPNSG